MKIEIEIGGHPQAPPPPPRGMPGGGGGGGLVKIVNCKVPWTEKWKLILKSGDTPRRPPPSPGDARRGGGGAGKNCKVPWTEKCCNCPVFLQQKWLLLHLSIFLVSGVQHGADQILSCQPFYETGGDRLNGTQQSDRSAKQHLHLDYTSEHLINCQHVRILYRSTLIGQTIRRGIWRRGGVYGEERWLEILKIVILLVMAGSQKVLTILTLLACIGWMVILLQ